MMRNIVEWTSFQHDHSHHFNEIGYRIEWGNNLRHPAYFRLGEQATEQIEDHNEKMKPTRPVVVWKNR